MAENAIKGLEPKLVWEHFYEISQVPRPSKKEEKVREFVREYAKRNKFEFNEDQIGNIVIRVPASKGLEKAPTIILQGHVDMVCEKNKGTDHDFENDPIELILEAGWIKANDTTLGADNGIGVATGMAAALDPEIKHGPLELLCTVDEETGLTGANALQPGFVKGKVLLNLDSEEDGAFYIGCSGGIDTLGHFKLKWSENKKGLKPYSLMVTGLKGGHSGMDIVLGRANAIKLLVVLLQKLSDVDYRLSYLSGGSLRNAIPREAEATILINPNDENVVKNIVKEFLSDMMKEYKKNDGGLKVKFDSLNNDVKMLISKKLTKRLVNCLVALPHGVMSMSPEIAGLVETSTNLATVKIDHEMLTIGTSQRSSITSARKNLAARIKSIFELAKASEVEFSDGYPGWQPDLNSEVLSKSISAYKKLNGQEPEIKAIHAGLECGILGEKYPGLDMISFGPTIKGAHSPDERVNVKDVGKFYTLLKEILRSYT